MVNSENIFQTVKPLNNIEADDDSFDLNVLTYINSVVSILRQMGVESDLTSVDEDTEWNDYLDDGPLLNMVKDYIANKVLIKFDPPTGSLLEALKESIKELEWRINIEVDPK